MEKSNEKPRKKGRFLKFLKRVGSITAEEVGIKARQQSDKSTLADLIIRFALDTLIPHSLERVGSKVKQVKEIIDEGKGKSNG